MAESTVIKYCSNCEAHNIEHKFQDTKYGKWQRVFNVNESGSTTCTVCGFGNKKK